MATLTVLKFEDARSASQALDTIKSLSQQHLINLHDAAIVTWPEGKKRPKTEQLQSLTGAGALNGAFWGTLFGLLFFVPLLGAAVGAAMGALSGSLIDVGIDDDFIKKTKSEVTEGTSALFLLTTEAVTDKVVDAMKQHHPQVIATNLSAEQEELLRIAFAGEE